MNKGRGAGRSSRPPSRARCRRRRACVALAWLAALLLLSPRPLPAQPWNPHYDQRIQEVVAGLTKVNGLTGWTPNAPDSWPLLPEHAYRNFASKRPVAGIGWQTAFEPARPAGLSLSNLKLQRAADFSRLSLRYLDLHDNQLRGVNLDGNADLDELNLANNQLNSIKLADCPRLRYLSLANNGLKAVNLAANTELRELFVSFNHLSELDLSRNQLLTDLGATNNQLESLDLSKARHLSRLMVSYNRIKNLDLASNPELAELGARDNELDHLDLRHNGRLTELLVSRNRLREIKLDNQPDLARLSADNNQLTSLDISRCPKLEVVELNNNPLSEFRLGDNDLQHLASLNLDGCRLPLSALKPLTDKAKSRSRFGTQAQVLFEHLSLAQHEQLDLSAEAEFDGTPTQFILLTEKGRRARPDSYQAEGGVLTFKAPGRYLVEMTNEKIFSSQINQTSGRVRTVKAKAVTGLVEVRPPLGEDGP